MIRTSFRRAIVPGIAVLALALTGCGAGNSSDDGGSDGGSAGGSLSGSLAGGGASSQDSAQQAWRAAFQTENSPTSPSTDRSSGTNPTPARMAAIGEALGNGLPSTSTRPAS